jgi:replication-associated recombination protein RarA
MAEFLSYDPWARTKTRNGLPADEVISSLQKSIRRGLHEQAIDFAYEMYISSPQLEEKLWRRLLVISVEDIGFGDVTAPVLIHSLSEIRKNFAYADGDRSIFFMQAIRYLCKCPKERSTDCLKNLVMNKFAHGYVPEVPDYAVDMHTVRGKANGKDVIHFLEEASRVEPVMEGYDDTYRQRMIEMVKQPQQPPVEGAFEYNCWQE